MAAPKESIERIQRLKSRSDQKSCQVDFERTIRAVIPRSTDRRATVREDMNLALFRVRRSAYIIGSLNTAVIIAVGWLLFLY